jgi:nitrate reductase alpha subunit
MSRAAAPRGASYSWYLYSANRVKYPLIRSRLLRLWRAARATMPPVAAWASIQNDPAKRKSTPSDRGHGGFVRATWDEVNEIIAAANAYTARHGGRTGSSASRRSRRCRWSPTLPARATSAARRRLHVVLRLVLRPAAGLAADLGRADRRARIADWYNAGFLMLWGSNVPQTRTPDAHFYTEARYKGAKSVVICPTIRGVQVRRPLAAPQSRAPTRRSRWRWAM